MIIIRLITRKEANKKKEEQRLISKRIRILSIQPLVYFRKNDSSPPFYFSRSGCSVQNASPIMSMWSGVGMSLIRSTGSPVLGDMDVTLV